MIRQGRRRWWSAVTLWLLIVPAPLMAAEEPPYTVIDTRGEIEVRRYGPAILAETDMVQPDGGFKRLAGYIFGGNASGESIAMTAPVQRELSGELRHMAFFMPTGYDMNSLPQPGDSDVRLREVPARTVAVLRFSGRATQQRVAQQRSTLAQQLVSEGLEARGDWLLNQYNPPWTPPFMRRNEIWVELQWPGSLAEAD